jgi:hypothetical protein
MTRYRGRIPPKAQFKVTLPSGPKIDAEMQRAVATYTGPILKVPAGRGSRRVKLKPLRPIHGDDGEEGGNVLA